MVEADRFWNCSITQCTQSTYVALFMRRPVDVTRVLEDFYRVEQARSHIYGGGGLTPHLPSVVQLGCLGECCKLPSAGQSPGHKRISSLKVASVGHVFGYFYAPFSGSGWWVVWLNLPPPGYGSVEYATDIADVLSVMLIAWKCIACCTVSKLVSSRVYTLPVVYMNDATESEWREYCWCLYYTVEC